MKENICKYEQSVLKEQTSLAQNKELAAHIDDCSNCREALKVASWMQNFASMTVPQTLPKSGFIWWKTQIRERQKKAERATQPIVWAQTAAIVLISATIIWIFIKNQSQLVPTGKALFTSLELVGAPLLIVLTCGAFIYLAFTYKWREPSRKK